MASISTKLFVNASTYEDFSKITPSDKKIYFINDTKQIYAKGIYYGVSASDFNDVKKALNGYLGDNDKTVAEAIDDKVAEVVTAYEAADAAIITAYQAADDKLYTTYIKPNADAIEVLNSEVDTKGSVTYTATYIVTSTMNDLDNYWDTL